MSVRGPTVLVLLGLVGPGCYDGFDPLDPEVLAGIARERGDAQGIALSGIYRGDLETLECGCQDVEGAQELSLCSVVDLANQFDQQEYLPVTVLQADGSVKIRTLPENQVIGNEGALSPTLYGPLDADGQLVAGGLLRADGLIAQGQVFARIDGTLTGTGSSAVLEAEYLQRYRVEVSESLDQLDVISGDTEIRSVDCRERIGLELSWVEPLPDSLQPDPE